MSFRNDLIEDVRKLLARAGFALSERIQLRPVGFDMLARRDDLLLILKVLGNADAFSSRVAHELRTLARLLDASPLLVAERTGAGDLEDGVVYSHRGIPALTFQTLVEFIEQNTPPMAYASPGGLYVQLRSELLRMIRTQRELSLGILAQVAGVSRRAIQMYEDGMHATIDSALRLEEFLNENLVAPIDPFEVFHLQMRVEETAPEITSRLVGEFASEIVRMLRAVGFRVVPTSQSPFTALSKEGGEVILTGVERNDTTDEERARILASVREVAETDAMYVVNRDSERKDLHGTPIVRRRELERLRDPQELFALVRERRRRPVG